MKKKSKKIIYPHVELEKSNKKSKMINSNLDIKNK